MEIKNEIIEDSMITKKNIRYLKLFLFFLGCIITIWWLLVEIEEKGLTVFLQFFSSSIVSGLALSMLLFIMVSGFFLIFGLADVINFAHGAFFMLGGFIGYEIYILTESFLLTNRFFADNLFIMSLTSFIIAIIGVAIILGLLGAGIEISTVRRLYGKPISQILLTVGFLFIILKWVEIVWGPATFTYKFIVGSKEKYFFLPKTSHFTIIEGFSFELYRLFIIFFGLFIVIIMFTILSRTRIGYIIQAGIEDSEMVDALGINVKRMFMYVFIAGIALAGIGGVVAVPVLGANLNHASNFLLYAFIIVVIGGAHYGRLEGTFFGSLIVGISYTFCQYFFTGFEGFVIFFIMAFVLIFKPGGLTGEAL